MLFSEIAEVSRRVGETRARLRKIDHLAACLARLTPDEIEPGVSFLSGELPGGRVGVGPAVLQSAQPGVAAARPAVSLTEVSRALGDLAEVGGPGSASLRAQLLGGLLTRMTSGEQGFLVRLLLGEVRQGALAGILIEALARAAQVSSEEIRRALTLAGDLVSVAKAVLTEGRPGLARFFIELFRPVQPMLARTAEGLPAALERLGELGLEWKLDGARVQIHKAGADVRVFSRRLNDVTAALPEIVEAVRGFPQTQILLDGEVLALTAEGLPQPFQTTMRRFGRKTDVERMRREFPLTPFFFDCLYLEGQSLAGRPAAERFDALSAALPAPAVIPRIVTAELSEAETFFVEALRRGHEGVVAKSLEALYEAGRRGQGWLKVKPAETLDLVVLAAEWGHGRRRGWLSNLHLGARDPETGGFSMLGKTFKGLTDEMLEWQTRRLIELEIARDEYTVYVRPQIVVEVSFDEVQASPRYPAGMALRFARVKRFRLDKEPGGADTVGAVRALFSRRKGLGKASLA